MKLKVSSLCFSYAKNSVLTDVSFTADEGKICVLLGANGAGKSTLIKILAGINKAKKGGVFIDGKSSAEFKSGEYASKIAYVPQNPTFESTTVLDAVLIGRLPLFHAPGKIDYEKAQSAIEKVGIADLAIKDASKLSGGEKQKVAIARALCGDAELILMDEPVSDLDIRSRYAVLSIIKELAKSGKTIILSMHDLNEALEIGDSFLVLSDGKIVADGDNSVLTEELLFNVFGVKLHKVEHDGSVHFHINNNSQEDQVND